MSGSPAKKRKNVLYSVEELNEAIKAVKKGTPINIASRKYNIPRSTLHSKIINKYKGRTKPGPASTLTTKEESKIAKWINYMCSLGRPITKDHIINSVALLVDKEKRTCPFANGRPGRHWLDLFFSKHDGVRRAMRETRNVSNSRVTEGSLKKWFSRTKANLQRVNLHNVEPSRIFNMDGITLSLNPAGTGKLSCGGGNNHFNAVVTGNAAGQLAPLMIVPDFPQTFDLSKSLPNKWSVGIAEEGDMDYDLLYKYIECDFYPWLVRNGAQFPVILFLDKYVTHLTQPLSEYCIKHKIVLIALPPDATHFMQPLEISFFRLLKENWKKSFDLYRKKNVVSSIKKAHIGKTLSMILDGMNLVEILEDGFKKSGLYPFSADSVDYSKLPKQPSRVYYEPSWHDYSLLKSIEKYIDSETLRTFRSAVNNKKCRIRKEDTSLFNVWKKILQNDKRIVHHNESMLVDSDTEELELIRARKNEQPTKGVLEENPLNVEQNESTVKGPNSGMTKLKENQENRQPPEFNSTGSFSELTQHADHPVENYNMFLKNRDLDSPVEVVVVNFFDVFESQDSDSD